MKTLDYSTLIKESLSELKELERKEKRVVFRDYLRFLRYLKEGIATSQAASGALIGLGVRQSQRIWQKYKNFGLVSLLELKHEGSVGNLSYVQISLLRSFLRSSETDLTQEQISDWIFSSFGVRYSQSGISKLFKRLKIKLKTGRPVNIRQEAGAVEAFKKTSVIV